jgi:hypothetical protein
MPRTKIDWTGIGSAILFAGAGLFLASLGLAFLGHCFGWWDMNTYTTIKVY